MVYGGRRGSPFPTFPQGTPAGGSGSCPGGQLNSLLAALGRSWTLWGALWSLLGALCAVLCTLLVSSPLLDALLVDLRLNFGPSLDASTLDFARPYGTLAIFFQNHCSPLQVLFGSLLGRLETLFGPSWDPLGTLLPSLGALWAALGRLLGALGSFLGALGALLGRSWPRLGALRCSLGAPGRSWGTLGAILGRSWTASGPLLGTSGRSSVVSSGSWTLQSAATAVRPLQ